MKTFKSSDNVYIKVAGYTFIVVYILWSSKEIARLSNDVDNLKQSVRDLQIISYGPEKLTAKDNNDDNEPIIDVRNRNRRSAKGNEDCKEKKYLRKCRKKLKKKPSDKIHADQLTLDFKVNSSMFAKLATTKQDCFSEFGGTVCYNSKTFINGGKNNIVSLPWKHLRTNELSPLQPDVGSGQYKVRYDGLFLVYINVLFLPTQREERVSVFLDNIQILTCQEGLDPGQELTSSNKQFNLTERSCSSLGVFIIQKHQILSIRVETKNTRIRLWSVGNTFGAVLLLRT